MSIRKEVSQTTPLQFEILVSYLQKHHDMAVGLANSTEAKTKRSQLWIRLTDKLNQYGPPTRNCVEWKSIWSNYKYNLKRKLAASLKLAKRKNNLKRITLNRTEQVVANLLGLKDKLANSGKGERKSQLPIKEDASDPLMGSSSPTYNNSTATDIEVDDKEGIAVSDDFNSTTMTPVIDSVDFQSSEQECIQMGDFDLNVPSALIHTLAEMQKTQMCILKELKESNRQTRNSHDLKELFFQLEREKLDEKKQQNFDENKQTIIKIELKRKQLEVCELKLKGLCTQWMIKTETD